MNRIICALFVLTAISHATAEEYDCSVKYFLCENASNEFACSVRYDASDNGRERVYIRGIDGVEREVKILSPEEYDFLTNRLEAAWAFMHSSHENRVKVHGSSVRAYVDNENAEKITEYKDGYRFVEKMVVKTRKVRNQIDGSEKRIKPPKKKPGNISERQWKARLEREAAEKAAPREVNVIYNANNGTIKEVK